MRLYSLVWLLAALALTATAVLAQQANGKVTDLVWPAPKDLIFKIDDLAGASGAIAGKVTDLQIKETTTEIKSDLAADVLFDFDKSTLRPSARTALKQVASIIRDNAKGHIVKIDGYTDSKGSNPYNQRLSDRRATSVKSWLIAKEGLSNVNFETEGFGREESGSAEYQPGRFRQSRRPAEKSPGRDHNCQGLAGATRSEASDEPGE